MKLSEMPKFDAAYYLDSPEAMTAYMNAVLSEGDSAAINEAIGTMSRAFGMTKMAEITGLSREALYRSFKLDTQPRFDTVAKVCNALGVQLVVQPK